MQSPAKAAGIAAGAGVLAISVILLLLMILFEPSSGSEAVEGIQIPESAQSITGGVEAGDEIPAVLGITVGAALAAAGTGFLLDEDPLDIF